jgi:hypothetical protein
MQEAGTMSEAISPDEREKFEMYVFEMNDVVEEFVDDAHKAGFTLDYSLDSLVTLEEYWLVGKGGEDPERLLQRSARYFGEVFRKNVGGRWELCSDDPQDMYFKFPVIAGYSRSQPHMVFCPLFVFRNFKVRERRGILRTAIEADMEYAD